MNSRFSALAACAALGIVLAPGARAQTTPSDPAAAMPPSSASSSPSPMSATSAPAGPSASLSDTDKLFMLRAAQGDMAEIKTSQMALKKTKNSGVKDVANTLIAGHSQSLKEGMGLATLLGLTLPKDPGPSNDAIAMQLQGADGKSFDKLYLGDQTDAHENTIALYGMELSQGQDPQVKAFAAKYLPGIEGHTQLIYQAAKQVNAPYADARPAMPPTVPGYPASMAPVSASAPAMPGMSTPAAGSPGMSTPPASTP